MFFSLLWKCSVRKKEQVNISRQLTKIKQTKSGACLTRRRLSKHDDDENENVKKKKDKRKTTTLHVQPLFAAIYLQHKCKNTAENVK